MLRQTIVVANLDDLPGYDPFSQNGANVNFNYPERLQRSDQRFRAAPLAHVLHYERWTSGRIPTESYGFDLEADWRNRGFCTIAL